MTNQAALSALRPPRDDAEWARLTNRRLERSENPTTQRIGAWVLSEDPSTGDMLASHSDGGSVRLAVKPDATDNPDTVLDTSLVAAAKLARATASSDSIITWESVEYTRGDAWVLSTPPGQEIQIPYAGVWSVKLVVVQAANNATDRVVWLARNGTRVMQETRTWGNAAGQFPVSAFYLSDDFALDADDRLSAGANFNYGTAPGQAGVVTSLALSMQTQS